MICLDPLPISKYEKRFDDWKHIGIYHRGIKQIHRFDSVLFLFIFWYAHYPIRCINPNNFPQIKKPITLKSSQKELLWATERESEWKREEGKSKGGKLLRLTFNRVWNYLCFQSSSRAPNVSKIRLQGALELIHGTNYKWWWRFRNYLISDYFMIYKFQFVST